MQQKYIYALVVVFVLFLVAAVYLTLHQKKKEDVEASATIIPSVSGKSMPAYNLPEPKGIMYSKVNWNSAFYENMYQNNSCTALGDMFSAGATCVMEKINLLRSTGQADSLKGDQGDFASIYFANKDKFTECEEVPGLHMTADVSDVLECEKICTSENACQYYTYNGITKQCFRWDKHDSLVREGLQAFQNGSLGCYRKPDRMLLGVGSNFRNKVKCKEPAEAKAVVKVKDFWACKAVAKTVMGRKYIMFDRRGKSLEQVGGKNCFVYDQPCTYLQDPSNEFNFYYKF